MSARTRWSVPCRVAAVIVVIAADLLVGPAAGSRLAQAAPGRSFYLSPTGSDAANGRSEATAWKSLARASRERFLAGDQILLQGGGQFDGQLVLEQDDAGSADAPVTISSYGSGRPTIRALGTEGIKVYNAGGVEVRGIDVVGDAAAYAGAGGITFFTDDKAPGPLNHITVSDVDVSNFKFGIFVISVVAGRGFQDVSISNSKLHNNRDSGLLTFGPAFDADQPSYAHRDVKVTGVTAYENPGDPQNTVEHSGSGILLGSVDGGTVEASSAYDNGALCPAVLEGPVGIWTYDSTNVTIQRNVSYRNRSGGAADGGGFDLDQNVSASILQYNLSYANAGPGLLVYTAEQNDAQRGNTVRFNVSVNDATGSGQYGGLTVGGRVRDTAIYHNTIVARSTGSRRPAAATLMDGPTGVSIQNNILLSQEAGAAFSSPAMATSNVWLQGNAYYRQGGGATVQWGDRTYDSLKSWRAATGQEKTADGAETGVESNPKLQDATVTPTVTDPGQITTVTQFALASDSPAGGRGIDLTREFPMSEGAVDYFGATLGGSRPISIGAAQPATVAAPTASSSGDGRSPRSWLWAVALVLLLLVGGRALTVAVRARRRPPPPPGWNQRQETIVVPSSRYEE